jgi:hypothetical protein
MSRTAWIDDLRNNPGCFGETVGAGTVQPAFDPLALPERRHHLSGKTLSIDLILAMLAETPQRIATLTNGLTKVQLHTPPGNGEWSASDVLAHLRSCADVWGECIARILSEDKPVIRVINPRTWINKTNYNELEFGPSLEAYTIQRNDLLAVLEPLAPRDWSRLATITDAGRPQVRSVYTYAEWLAVHERSHYKQFKRLASAVGR